MEISDEIKKYLIVFGALLVLVYFLFKASSDKPSCDGEANDFRDKAVFNLILDKKENHYQSRDSYFYGIDLNSKEATEFYDGSGWIEENFNKFKIGDTLIKNMGKYTIVIRRKGITILIPFECGGKTYLDK